MKIPRCCVCRAAGNREVLETTDLPGSGYRCRDRVGCKRRVKETVSAHKAFGDICDDGQMTDGLKKLFDSASRSTKPVT